MKGLRIAGIAVAILLVVAVGVAAASGGLGALSGDDEAVTGSDADRAAQVAREYVEARGIDAEYSHVEAGDEDGVAYEVEFSSADGEVEVQVDSDFQVIDHASESGDGGEDEDQD